LCPAAGLRRVCDQIGVLVLQHRLCIIMAQSRQQKRPMSCQIEIASDSPIPTMRNDQAAGLIAHKLKFLDVG
jgi:hypothetical protein